MKTVAVFEAKTHFSALIEEARNGETIMVTRNGRAVAQIGPVASHGAKTRAQEAMKRILSSKATLGDSTVRELIEGGRRY
ncbi:MAG: type II toxin-antitoxin system prevent-host-death family antitoxin [Candidatus Eremiobacteraeota bacterium]|nr:type II toxin-antitoxin system prevent-host-death family antitoxin [Candidatus Eremiobacteraeota bacterium]MBC5802525.1 type II toxin-antitoxin system prevent-host-death family antitoxin [Candidatus Eremiobacteraeota bacterium]MBC5820407.1 type II toxin-antitoxin system prevent-host-death family antitoxin [Candidatus Eremiobacteraeota bacterium]